MVAAVRESLSHKFKNITNSVELAGDGLLKGSRRARFCHVRYAIGCCCIMDFHGREAMSIDRDLDLITEFAPGAQKTKDKRVYGYQFTSTSP